MLYQLRVRNSRFANIFGAPLVGGIIIIANPDISMSKLGSELIILHGNRLQTTSGRHLWSEIMEKSCTRKRKYNLSYLNMISSTMTMIVLAPDAPHRQLSVSHGCVHEFVYRLLKFSLSKNKLQIASDWLLTWNFDWIDNIHPWGLDFSRFPVLGVWIYVITGPISKQNFRKSKNRCWVVLKIDWGIIENLKKSCTRV